jgi:enamine deaminase RidA (YjgF/YER057c/UK114 family)
MGLFARVKLLILSALFALPACGGDYFHLPLVECREFADCFREIPAGRVVATTVYLTEIGDYGAMNAVYEKAFPGLKPARNTVQVLLRAGMRMGWNAVVYRGSGEVTGLTPPGVTNLVPITPGIRTPDRLFIAGILGRDSNTGQIPEAPEAQVEMCLARLRNVLATAGLGPGDLLQATVYHTAKVPREVLDKKLEVEFGHHSVAFTVLQVDALALGAQVGLNGAAVFGCSGKHCKE